ncbi:MAG: hypothetical protein Q9227_004340 [Pyrenula ochraceoflavens]
MVTFLSLLPSLTLYLTVLRPLDLGTSPASGHLLYATILNGSLISSPSSPSSLPSGVSPLPPLSATIIPGSGSDFLTADADLQHYRLGVRALMQTDDGEYIEFEASGVQNVTEESVGILTGKEEGGGPIPYGGIQDGVFSPFSQLLSFSVLVLDDALCLHFVKVAGLLMS